MVRFAFSIAAAAKWPGWPVRPRSPACGHRLVNHLWHATGSAFVSFGLTAGMLPTLTFCSAGLEAAYLSHAAPTRARTAARFACFRFVLLLFTAARRVAGRVAIRAAAAGAVPPFAAARRRSPASPRPRSWR